MNTHAEVQKLIDESEGLQSTLERVVGRPSSHIVGRVKALRDVLALLSAPPAQSEAANGEVEQRLTELLWTLYEGMYGHRKADGIDPFTTAVHGALAVHKAFYERKPAQHEQTIAALRVEVERLKGELVETRFRPLGDNHHNAAACPYCNPQLEKQDAEIERLREANGCNRALAKSRYELLGQSPWINLADRPPTEGDGRQVLWAESHGDGFYGGCIQSWNAPPNFATHWMPIPPIPPDAQPVAGEGETEGVLFLDVDGVLNTHRLGCDPFGPPHWGIFDEFLQRVRRIVCNTGCRIVLSSSWRYGHTLPLVTQRLDHWCMKITDVTPQRLREPRHTEIQEWLDANQTERFAIIDDSEDACIDGSFFKTDPAIGLTDEIVDAVIQHLKQPSPAPEPAAPACATCNGERRILQMYDRPFSPPGNQWIPCPDCLKPEPAAIDLSRETLVDENAELRKRIEQLLIENQEDRRSAQHTLDSLMEKQP